MNTATNISIDEEKVRNHIREVMEMPKETEEPPTGDLSLADDNNNSTNTTITSGDLLIVKSAPEWMSEARARPVPRQLFSEFWYEGELCILFADTNVGKSILAFQLADSISKGERIRGFKMEAPKQRVLYLDFELSDKQMELRYSNNYEQHYTFRDEFRRAEINPEGTIPGGYKSFEDYLVRVIEEKVVEEGAQVLIIDNITYLKDETEKARAALPLMKSLQTLKKKHHLSILALAHTPKRDASQPISRNDLQGSKMLINFCDSSFAIGESVEDDFRYLKQIKVRNGEKVYHEENVCTCRITKPDNFLQFEFLGFGRESEHLKRSKEEEREELEKTIQEWMNLEPGITSYAIAKHICPSDENFEKFRGKVDRMMKKISRHQQHET